MNKTPNYDAKVKVILDATTSGERICELTGEKWMMDEEEISWYKKFNVPPSPYAPLTRWELLTSFWTGFQWWNHKHPETGANLLSFYHPATGVSVLPDKEWFDRDFSSEFLEDDSTRSVFDNLYDLMRRIPLPASSNLQETENSIATVSGGDRHSYFMCGCESEHSLFGFWSTRLVSSCLVNNSDNVSDSYNISNSKNIHKSFYIRDCGDVMSSSFCFNCEDVEFCFGATNKRHARYIFMNEQLSKDDYEQRVQAIDLSRRSVMETWTEKFHDLVGNKTVWPENLNDRAEQSSGEYLYDVSDCHDCYACVKHCSNLYQCLFGVSGRDSAFSTPIFSENCFEANNCFRSNNIKFCYGMYGCQGVEYSFLCYECEDCFGCVGLRHKKFHIFNKPYSEDAYWKKLDEIKSRMVDLEVYGRSLPLRVSPTCFAESGAVKYLGTDVSKWRTLGGEPFDLESAGAIGDLSAGSPRSSQEIPDSIDEMHDEDWIGKPVLDEEARRRFSFIKPELDFYRRKRFTPPMAHMTRRMDEVLHESNLGVFEDTKCAKCSKEIRVAKNITYPQRTIYCNGCYVTYLEETT